MLRNRVLKHWAQVASVRADELSVPEDMKEVLRADVELTIADMKKWILRECDVAEYKWWMPHRVVSRGAIVRIYYVWTCKALPKPEYTIVLTIGAGRAEINKWNDYNVTSQPAAIEKVPKAIEPDIVESAQIMNYLSQFKRHTPAMTVNGSVVKKIE